MAQRNQPIKMGLNPITGLSDPVDNQDAATKSYVDTEIAVSAHDAVTITGTPDYLTLSGQQLTRGLIDLTTDVTGVLPVSNFTTGTPTGAKFVRDDGVLAVPYTHPWTDGTLSSDATNSTTSWTDVGAELSFSVSANTDYVAFFWVVLTSTSTGSASLAVNGPSGASFYLGSPYSSLSGSAVTAYDTTAFFAPAGGAADYVQPLMIAFYNGANAGTLALRFKLVSAVGSAIVRKGSWMQYREM